MRYIYHNQSHGHWLILITKCSVLTKTLKTPKVVFEEINGKSYEDTWKYQQDILDDLVKAKRALREADPDTIAGHYQNHRLLLCEHSPVFTLGKSGSMDHLLLSQQELSDQSIEFFKINRGGDITYHGPGQITGYPIFDLAEFFSDIHRYIRTIEEIIIKTISHYGIKGSRIEGFTGVWIQGEDGRPNRKICAIGVHLSRWVTMHGFALNVNTDLGYFKKIVPCGIEDEDKEVTSIANELGHLVEIDEVKSLLKRNFAQEFKFEYKT